MYTSMKLKTSNNRISDFIKQNIILFDSFDNVYLFGSILNINKIPNDIDILLIYSEYSKKIIDDSKMICSVLETISGLPIDLTVLSIEEEKDAGFLERINSHYLKLK